MSSIESKIDDLYRLPLREFVGARAALARSLAGAEAARVRKLPKPTVVPWAVNQVYWRARPLYDRAMKAGERVRQAQVAALGGRKADPRTAGEAHRRAIADAVHQAETFAATAALSRADPGALTRTFEALSLAPNPPAEPGRLVRPLQPAGFEALAGIPVKIKVKAPSAESVRSVRSAESTKSAEAPAERAASGAEDAARRKRDAALRKVKRAEAAVERARRRMVEAEEALRRTRDQAS